MPSESASVTQLLDVGRAQHRDLGLLHKLQVGQVRLTELLQARALREGILYQTLTASILHKYVHGT